MRMKTSSITSNFRSPYAHGLIQMRIIMITTKDGISKGSHSLSKVYHCCPFLNNYPIPCITLCPTVPGMLETHGGNTLHSLLFPVSCQAVSSEVAG